MPAAAERSPSASSLSGRRILSKIASPFGPKSRNVHEYCITLDEPLKHHSGGDQVTGTVHLKLNKPIRVTHLVVCLHGFVQVYKNPGQPPTDHRSNAHVGTGRSKSGEYFGNGFASLFEDEVVLCGDGRLDVGDYEFQFELEFPDRDLPSGITFERGTISYQITATLTRPTTISPTLQCEKKVYFIQKVDISNVLPPKIRTITLGPISRRSRAKTHARKLVDSDRKGRQTSSMSTTQPSNGRRDSQTSSSPSLHMVGGDSVNSPAPSELSFDSLSGSQGPTSQQESNTASPRPSDVARSKVSLSPKTITTEVELLVGGCLRGDNIPVRIHVDHTKHVKSLHGIIITLYRQARVDLHPAIPVGPTERGKEAKYEDYYPKSLTGLGGLSLSGAGSSHTFRKDLSQTVLPLIVDRSSLVAEVAGKVHVPEEAFATISTVPGAMISFRYYVEVVVDIQGKLATQDRNLGNLGGLTSTVNQVQVGTVTAQGSGFNQAGARVIDTAAVKRNKGVVYCTFEIAVGTHDSERRKGKRKVEPNSLESGANKQPSEPQQQQQQQQQQQRVPTIQDVQFGSLEDHDAYYSNHWYGPDQGYYDAQYYDQQEWPISEGYNDHTPQSYVAHQGVVYEPPPVPMPRIEDESQLPEKERLRRAEERLLPSQPPEMESQASSGAHVPTAPYLPDEHLNGYAPHTSGLLTPPTAMASSSRNGVASSPFPPDFASIIPLPATPRYEATESAAAFPPAISESIPAYEARNRDALLSEPGLPPDGTDRTATTEKRDLERRRLQIEESAPPPDDDAESSAAAAPRPLPSAPVLMDDDELYTDVQDSHADASGSAGLPRYER